MTTLRLVDGTDEMLLYPRSDMELRALDLGFPDARDIVEDVPDTDGQIDTTTNFGGRVVAIELALFDAPLALADQIRTFMHPSRRPYLYVGEAEWGGERRLSLRPAQATLTREPGVLRAAVMQTQWRVPTGIVEDAVERTATLPAFTGAASAGVTFPTTLPRAFATVTNTSTGTFAMAGSVPVHWLGRMYGPCSGPRITLTGTGETLSFPTLTLLAGQYLEVDTRQRTARINGAADASRLANLDFAGSKWWQLQPGTNTVRYNPLSVSSGAQAVLFWRQAWL